MQGRRDLIAHGAIDLLSHHLASSGLFGCRRPSSGRRAGAAQRRGLVAVGPFARGQRRRRRSDSFFGDSEVSKSVCSTAYREVSPWPCWTVFDLTRRRLCTRAARPDARVRVKRVL